MSRRRLVGGQLAVSNYESSACFIVRDASGQALAYVYFEEEPGRRSRRLKGPGHSWRN